jgi:hypothetical protein
MDQFEVKYGPNEIIAKADAYDRGGYRVEFVTMSMLSWMSLLKKYPDKCQEIADTFGDGVLGEITSGRTLEVRLPLRSFAGDGFEMGRDDSICGVCGGHEIEF